MSFDCLIVDKSGKEHRDYISFDLRIPRANTEKEVVFTYDMVAAMYGGQEKLYAAIKHFYNLGRSKANIKGYTHGNCPDYDSLSYKYDQFIRHTEQLLVAYLALPRAAVMLRNRLRSEIRGKYSQAATVKIYNMGLHMHSTKTCCPACEYSLIGLMNERNGFEQNGKKLGFLSNFKRVCSTPNDLLTFTLPERSWFRFLTTVSASEPDHIHQTQPDYTAMKLKPKDPVPSHIISVKDTIASHRIYTSMLSSGYDQRKLPSFSSLTDRTVGISGSKASPGSPGTKDRVKAVRDKELKQVEKCRPF